MDGGPARSGLGLAVNVLGVGALFLPWTAQAVQGRAALWGWGYHVVAGALLVGALTAVSRAPGAAAGAISLIDGALGRAPGRAVRAFYVLGITAGQVVVALVAAGFLGQALAPGLSRTAADGSPGADGFIGWVAAGVLVLAVALASSDREVAGLWVFGALLVLLALALLTGARAAPGTAGGPSVAPIGIAKATALQFFVVVGWEASCRLAPTTGRRRWPGPLGGVIAVGILYGAVLSAAPSTGTVPAIAGLALPDLGGSAAGRAVSAGMGVVTAYFCVRNIRTAARLAADLSGRGASSPRTVATTALSAGAAALAGVALVQGGLLTATDALSVPNAMAWAVFLTAAVAAVVAGTGRGRGLGAAAVAAYLPLLPFLGAAVLLPLAVLGGAALLDPARSRSGRREPS
ncbi:hypothetical protein GCM10010211_04960 [Streptomyces albospinus]|uniref:Amino acid permease n=1 Tax=Streptomyces albospinus TaxID=285515 RepID=A0ABQ2UMK0_9ACTN|nr:hypothetical protein [Streptomyces albospinus]GGU44369.1 hypothetical protein GCM10010211_04960 [Streptomyces albospinus]